MSHDVMRLVGRRERSASCSVVAAAPHARSASPDPNFPPSTGLAAAEMDGMILLICQSIVKKQPSACGYSWRISTFKAASFKVGSRFEFKGSPCGKSPPHASRPAKQRVGKSKAARSIAECHRPVTALCFSASSL